jgi:CubicO group peptidase (beta-lactamase class C family)
MRGGVRGFNVAAAAAITLLLLVLPTPSVGQSALSGGQPLEPFAVGSPSSVGLSEDGLDQATALLQAHIDAGDIAGVVAAVVRDGTLVYHQALGYRDLESGNAMSHDALFRIYSMTRPITALGILMLHDDGLLDVDDPVQRYLPQFAGQEVLRDAASMDPSETRPRVGDITLAQLLTHTSGVGSRGSTLYRNHGVHSWDQTLEEVVDNVAALPLFEDPGTGYRYGMHSEILGRVIEVVSGRSLQEFLQERIFGPLGMTDTVFRVDSPRRHRLATVYRPDRDGCLRPHQMESIPVTEERALTSSGVGLVASTTDLLRFSQFILDGGRIRGDDGGEDPLGEEPLLRPETLRMIMENAVPEGLLPLGGSGYWAGSGWSLGGFAVVLDPSSYGHGVTPDEVWWDGSAGTRLWIDPHENMVTLIQAQVSPAGGNGFREGFKSRVHASIVERRTP